MARRRGNRWQADVKFEGRRIRRSFATKAEAELWEKSVAVAQEKGEGLTLDNMGSGEASSLTFRGFVSAHFEFLWGT